MSGAPAGSSFDRMDRMSTTLRKKRAAEAAGTAGVDALLVTHLPDVRYLCGFTGSSAALVLTSGASRRAVLFTDGRYTAQAKAEAAGTRVSIAPKPLEAACQWMVKSGVLRCGFDAAQTTVAVLAAMRKAVAAAGKAAKSKAPAKFTPVAPLVARLREIKDAEEIQQMKAAAAMGCALFDHILGFLEPGIAETAVAAELEHAARLAGAEGMSFSPIVTGGVRTSMPHGRPSGAKIPARGFVTLDFGVLLKGYCSDMTRTVHMGKATAEERQAYDAVLEAQEAGVAAARAGVTAGDVDEATRSVLRRAKLDKWFTHGTGHGVGLEIHEPPRLGAKQTQPLEAGMVVTIEPGIYMPGKFGLRIEDTVVITSTGCEIITPSTKAWIQL
jgi:Xaa-Pro aminopeptidase